MPVAQSQRYRAMVAMVTTLQTVKPANGYTFDLSRDGAVSELVQLADARKAMGLACTIRLWDGEETYEFQAQQGFRTASLDVLLDLQLLDVDGAVMVLQLNLLLQDVHRCLNANRDLGLQGAVDCKLAGVEAPDYDLANGTAHALVHVEVRYDYQAGVSL